MTSQSLQYPPGTVLLGKYRIERVLGEGGMGVVALAMHIQLEERVALKFLLPQVMGNREVVQRFLREAQAAVRLKGENVARVIDVGTLDDGIPYMVMEYLSGSDLSELLDAHGALRADLSVDYILQACEALAEAHALGIVHRDVKPANFFLTQRPDGSPLLKVLDFGISKAPSGLDQGLTSTQAIIGTPAYMSPEQMRASRDVDPRSDVWALGVVLYELLSGHRPFDGQTYSELCISIAVDPLPPLELSEPAGLADVVHRCLEKDPAGRYQNVAELTAALAPYASSPTHAQLVVGRASRMLRVAAPGLLATPAPAALGTGSATVHGTGPVGTPPPMTPSPSGPQRTTPLPAHGAGGTGPTVALPATRPPKAPMRAGVVIAVVAGFAALIALIAVFALGGGSQSEAEESAEPVASPGASHQASTADGGVAARTAAGSKTTKASDVAPIEVAPAPDAGAASAAVRLAPSQPDAGLRASSSARKRSKRRSGGKSRRKKPPATGTKPSTETGDTGDTGDTGEDDVLGSRH